MGWTYLTHAPAHPFAPSVNAMYTFNGRPTLFGNPECNEEVECPRTEVRDWMKPSPCYNQLHAACNSL